MDKHEKIGELAEALARCLIAKTRDDGEMFFCLDKEQPEYADWMFDLVYAAHDGKLPNDWSYEIISAAVGRIKYVPESTEDTEFATEFASGHSHNQLLNWVGSHGHRWALADELIEQPDLYGLADILERAMESEAQEVICIVYNHIATEAELALEED